jgi:hypothetical protein
MSWSKWLKEGRVDRHTTSREEIESLRSMVERDLRDARVVGTSADTRFIVAYNAALILAKIVVAASGYRIKGAGAHRTTFDAVLCAMGAPFSQIVTFFDACRRKRNIVVYDASGRVSEREVTDLLDRVGQFRAEVEAWLAAKHPGLGA